MSLTLKEVINDSISFLEGIQISLKSWAQCITLDVCWPVTMVFVQLLISFASTKQIWQNRIYIRNLYLTLLSFIFRVFATYYLGLNWATEFLSPTYLTDSYSEVSFPESVSDLPHRAAFPTLLELLDPILINHLHVDILLINLGHQIPSSRLLWLFLHQI